MPPAVVVSEVSKRFRLYHERPHSLKERIVNLRGPRYEEFWALRGVSMEINPAETAGLIGPNGSGKTTLLKMIAGIMRPTSGWIETRGRIASLLELGAGFHPDLTGRENVYMNASILGLSRAQTDRHFDEIVAFSELEPFIDMQVRHYSSGMYIRLGFAVAVHVDPEILIVDEVLAVGDEAFQRKCLDRIRQFQSQGRTIVFVTHAVDLVRTVCNRAFFLHRGEVVESGAPADVIRAFRQTIHGEAHLEAEPLSERGSGEIRISSVRFVGPEGSERQVFSSREPMEVVVDVETTEPVEDPVVGIALYDERDVCIYGTNSALRGMALGRVDGKLRVRMRSPSVPMLDGTCRVTVGVVSRDERHVYHWRDKAFAIRIVNTGSDLGTVDFDFGIEAEPL
jgi:ABC-2 type transport system ATP-binding protein